MPRFDFDHTGNTDLGVQLARLEQSLDGILLEGEAVTAANVANALATPGDSEVSLKAALGALTGWQVLEQAQPTSDVDAIEFSTDVAEYSSIMVVVVGASASAAAVAGYLEIRATGGTYRQVGNCYVSTNAAGDYFSVSWFVFNVNDADGTHLRSCVGINAEGGGYADPFARSGKADTGLNYDTVNGGYSSHDEAVNQVRITTAGALFEGSDATRRTVATLWGML